MSTTLTELELATRWAMSPKTLQSWRATKRGPEYRKLGKKVTAINNFSRLLAPKITTRDSDEIEMADGTERLTPEVLFVDLINNLEKLSALVKEVLDQASSKSTQLNRSTLLQAVDQYGDMSTRRRIQSLHRQKFKSGHDHRFN